MEDRLCWAREHQGKDWGGWSFTDETTFWLEERVGDLAAVERAT
jgi:hypothetical protein